MNTSLSIKAIKGALGGLALLGVAQPQSAFSEIETTYTRSIKGGGPIVNWSDETGWIGGSGYPNSSTDKAALYTGETEGAGGNAGLRYDVTGIHIGEFELVTGSIHQLQVYSFGEARSLTADRFVMNGAYQLQFISEEAALLTLNAGALEINSGTMEIGVGDGAAGVLLTAGSTDISGVLRVSNGGRQVALGDTMLREGGLITLGGRGLNGVVSMTSLQGSGIVQVYSSTSDNGALGTLRFENETGASATFDGILRDYNDVAGSASRLEIHKTGAGTQIISEAQTFSGGTTIDEGVLAVNNTSGSGLGTGSIVVTGDGILAGTGIIALASDPEGTGASVVVEAGGSIAPGIALDSGFATLTLSGANNLGATILEMQSGASFDFRLGESGISDQLAFTSYQADGLSLDVGGIAVNITGAQVGSYLLFSFDAIDALELEELAGLLQIGSGFEGLEGTFFISGNQIGLHVIPEPGSFALGLIGLTLICFGVRRRQ